MRLVNQATVRTLTAAAILTGYTIAKNYMSKRKQISFKGKVVLITGGSRGLGLVLAREIGREGALVAICARNQDELIQAKNWLAHEGVGMVMPCVCDVSNRQQVDELITEVRTYFGPIDILINNAGVIEVGPFEHMTISDFEEALNTNFWGTVYPSLAVLDQMREKSHGQIVNITSVGGSVSIPHMLPYSSAKFASNGFTQGLHAELKRSGIAVTNIVPGLMRTGAHLNANLKGQKEKEYLWFAISDTLPLLSMDVVKAAKKIMTAIRRRQAQYVLGLPAKLAIFLNGNFPGLMSELLSIVHAALPLPDESNASSQIPAKGKDFDTLERHPPLRVLTSLGRDAARRFQSYET